MPCADSWAIRVDACLQPAALDLEHRALAWLGIEMAAVDLAAAVDQPRACLGPGKLVAVVAHPGPGIGARVDAEGPQRNPARIAFRRVAGVAIAAVGSDAFVH